MARIGLVLHEAEPQALKEAERISASLGEQGHEVVSVADDVPAGSAITQVDPANFADGLNLAISLGGDGTMLRTVGKVRWVYLCDGCLLYTSPSPRDS